MLSPSALLRALVSRNLPTRSSDGQDVDVALRLDEYRGAAVASYIRKNHLLANEGSYFVANNLQTAITGQTTTAYDATKPSLLMVNTDSATGTNKRVFLDYVMLLQGGTAYSNATSNTGIFWGTAMDTGNRYSSGGTQLTVNNPNNDVAQAASVTKVYAGAIVTTAAASLRTIVGQRLFRLPVSATALTLANFDNWYFNFGGVEAQPVTAPATASNTLEASLVSKTYSAPPHIIGPNQSLLFNINCIAGGAVTAGNLIYEVGWWER